MMEKMKGMMQEKTRRDTGKDKTRYSKRQAEIRELKERE
jgi:hypothetical protein